MLFSEVYGAYFDAVAAVLKEAVRGPVSPARIDEIVREKAFAESVLTIGPSLLSGEWPLLTKERTTPLRNAPALPLTLLEKRWMKALLLDPRIRLFNPPADGLEEVEPLYDPNDVLWFDRYSDGDPYEDPEYIARFQTILESFKQSRRLRISYVGGRGRCIRGVYAPHRIEYSQKDDKFRLIVFNKGRRVIRISSMLACELDEPFDPKSAGEPGAAQAMLEIEITDERKALERAMLHFSHFRKEAERVGGREYRMRIWYDLEDEAELVIRVLSFGPMVRVSTPEGIKKQVLIRLERQMKLISK